jgi:drug/metabolite transporter (DMT)-like permease
VLALPFVAIIAAGNGGLDAAFGGIADAPVRLSIAAFGPGLVAILLFYRGLAGTTASNATLAEFMYPVAALTGNWAFLGVMISPAQLLGLLLVLATIVMLGWLSTSTATRPPTPAPALIVRPDPLIAGIQSGKPLSHPTLTSCPVRRRLCSRSTAG